MYSNLKLLYLTRKSTWCPCKSSLVFLLSLKCAAQANVKRVISSVRLSISWFAHAFPFSRPHINYRKGYIMLDDVEIVLDVSIGEMFPSQFIWIQHEKNIIWKVKKTFSVKPSWDHTSASPLAFPSDILH